MSDNTPAKAVTVWPWHYDEPAHSIFCKVSANSNRLFVLLETHSAFWFQYRLLTMTTFFEIAVYIYSHKDLECVYFKLMFNME